MLYDRNFSWSFNIISSGSSNGSSTLIEDFIGCRFHNSIDAARMNDDFKISLNKIFRGKINLQNVLSSISLGDNFQFTTCKSNHDHSWLNEMLKLVNALSMLFDIETTIVTRGLRCPQGKVGTGIAAVPPISIFIHMTFFVYFIRNDAGFPIGNFRGTRIPTRKIPHLNYLIF